MAEVSIDRVTAGSIVEKDVTMPNGALLAKSGTELKEQQIALLKKRGVRTVVVIDGDSPGGNREVSEKIYEKRCAVLEEAFRVSGELPHMAAIKTASKEHLRLKRPWE